ncbi:MAG: AAA family ATPase [Lachnospiraceae bacterium]|nr:AAA family ATPase [Lachnospiraceae bacterium]
MKFSSLYIRNFKSIRELNIKEVDNALILVGKNNTGKTVVLYAIQAITGDYKIKDSDFFDKDQSIVIGGTLSIEEEDLHELHESGAVSTYKKYEVWNEDFRMKFPGFQDGVLPFECTLRKDGSMKYGDGVSKNNKYLKQVFPKIYFIDSNRNIDKIQDDILQFQGNEMLTDLRENVCMFDKMKKCNRCFQCVGLINQKTPEELTIYETTRLLEYKLFQMNLNRFAEKMNKNFQKNGGAMQEIEYTMDFNVDEVFRVRTLVHNPRLNRTGSLKTLSAGFKSIYILSLLETYIAQTDNHVSSIIMIEDPEIFLHPQLQKVASEILYNLCKKNQVIFSTHSPNMIFNFSQKQIKQIVLDENYETVALEDGDIDTILDDLGYTANDLMNVNFVFIVEGKQDSNRLPMLLEKYYSEIYDEDGKLQRIAIVPVNSCTNIKTYANLKYINKLYLKDQFLMIRDSDGKNPNTLTKQLCGYYKAREAQDENNLPTVTPKNVLILKYYSFENYFLDPKTMVKIGLLKNEEEFYNILYSKYRDYLYKLGSTKRMIKQTGIRINSKQDLKNNMETIKIYVRGHNLFDIFYGRYKGGRKDEVLRRYIEEAPRDTFKDILDAIDNFVYFENRKQNREE